LIKREARILVHGCRGPVCCGLVLRGVFSVEAVFLSMKGVEGLAEMIVRSTVFHELEYSVGGGLGLPLKEASADMVPGDAWSIIEAYRRFAELVASRVAELAGGKAAPTGKPL